MELSEISGILGGKKAFEGVIASRLDLLDLSDKGLTKEALLHLAKHLHLSLAQMAEMLPGDRADDSALSSRPPLQQDRFRTHPAESPRLWSGEKRSLGTASGLVPG